ncbi:MAG: hypothetical protein M1838_005633 [Thelocarpon superellum]|nr:MAG: hypothetical protein M1838_005633 [Thelocarpon superellum]
MSRYALLVERGILFPQDTRELARVLHNSWRHSSPGLEQQQLQTWVETLARDLRRKAVPADPGASTRLLSFYRDAESYEPALEFWAWAKHPDKNRADARTYGSAIELLAKQGTSLHRLEELYLQALKRFPGTFSEYHLSPNAILLDRGQPTKLSGVSMSLLQGIITARLQHGDWRNAYLGLDTALRLHPTQLPRRVLELFALARPLPEKYTVILLMCRSGIVPSAKTLTLLLNSLALAQESTDQWPGPISFTNITLSTAMLSAWQAFIGAGGQLEVIHLNCVLRGLLGILPSSSNIANNNLAPQKQEVEKLVLRTVRDLRETYGHLGIPLERSTFNLLISMGDKLGRSELVIEGQERLRTSGLNVPPESFLALMRIAGGQKEARLIQESWTQLLGARTSRSDRDMQSLIDIRDRDWHHLVEACAQSNCLDFAEEQLAETESLETSLLTPRAQDGLREARSRLTESTTLGSKASAAADTATNEGMSMDALGMDNSNMTSGLRRAIDGVRSQMLMTTLRNFHTDPIPSSASSVDTSTSNEAYRALYDRVTTDQVHDVTRLSVPASGSAHDATPPTTSPATSSTGFPLAELRFENWKTVNDLLVLAEEESHSQQIAATQSSERDDLKDVAKADIGHISRGYYVSEAYTRYFLKDYDFSVL